MTAVSQPGTPSESRARSGQRSQEAPTGAAPARITLPQHVRHLISDTDTPISLFLNVAGDREAFLLESAEVDGRWGRYSVLGCDFALALFCRGGRLSLDIRDPRLERLADCAGMPFADGVRAVMRRLELVPDAAAKLPPITRALYGYFGYETAALFNPKLAAAFPDMPNQAEACLVLPGTLLVFDHLYHSLCQLSLGEHRDFSADRARRDRNDRSDRPASCEEAPSDAPGAPVTVHTGHEAYLQRVTRVREMLRQGEAIQVVPSTRFSVPFTGDPFTLYRRMRRANASPYMFFMRLPEITLFGSSPEVMVRCDEGRLLLSPIAGTRRRGRDDTEDAELAAELRQDPKEQAEHVMLVDLGRNDLGRVARAGSVKVERLMEVERFSHVMHLTSRVTARLEEGLDALDVLAATFPAGTVSGAPKIRAMEIIAEEERLPRGPYAGCIGWLGLDADSVNLDTGITIRSMWLREGTLNWQSGGGLVFDSDPESEWKECCNKAAIMRSVLENATGDDHVPARR